MTKQYITIHFEGDTEVHYLPHSFAHFPDGSVRFEAPMEVYPPASIDLTITLVDTTPTAVMALAQAAQLLHHRGDHRIHLVIAAMPDQRCDREEKFDRDGKNITGVAAVEATVRLITAMANWESITIMDPHSEATIGAFEELDYSVTSLLPEAQFKDFIRSLPMLPTHIIQVDAGAYERVCDYRAILFNAFNCDPIHVTMDKVREDGKVVGTQAVGTHRVFERNFYLIVDDICDGGRSFIEAAKALGLNTSEVALWTNLGIYSAGPVDFGYVGCALDISDKRKYRKGQRLTKTKGSSWQGKVVGFYETDLTPIGYAIESEREPGSVQIYPESALTLVKD